MNNNLNRKQVQKPDLIDVFVICWGILTIIFLSTLTWSQWTGKADYIVTNIFLLLFAWLYLKVRKMHPLEMFRWRPIPRAAYKGCSIMALSGAILLDELDRLVGLIIPVSETQVEFISQTLTPSSSFDLVLIIIGVTIFSPIVEESLFRGVIQQSLERRWDITKAVLVTSLIFAAIHFQPWWMIQQLILAVFLGYLSWRWNSIIPAVLIHTANNFWATANFAGLDEMINNYYLLKGHVNPAIILVTAIFFWQSFRRTEKLREKLRVSNVI